MKATITDVADRAKVSKATVSRIMSKSPGFKYAEETCKRVLSIAKELDYTPNSTGPIIRLKNTKLIGICIQARNSTFSYLIQEKLTAKIKEFGYFPIFIDVNESFELFGSTHTNRLDYLRGIVCLHSRQVKSIQKLCDKHDKDIPIISLDEETKPENCVKVVGIDHQLGKDLILNHLKDLGHKHIARIETIRVDAGFRFQISYINEINNEKQQQLLKPTNKDIYTYGREIAKYLTNNSQITAVSCPNDEMAVAVIFELNKRNIKVPDDISVTGYDNLAFAQYIPPPLTTIAQKTEEQVLLATKVLISSIEGNAIHQDFIPTYTKVKPELIIRESTSKPKQ